MARLGVEGCSQYVWQVFLQEAIGNKIEYRLLKLLTGAVRLCITERYWPTRTKTKRSKTNTYHDRSPASIGRGPDRTDISKSILNSPCTKIKMKL